MDELALALRAVSVLGVLATETFVLEGMEKMIPYLYRNPPAMRLFAPETS
jgi:hypothetical protein